MQQSYFITFLLNIRASMPSQPYQKTSTAKLITTLAVTLLTTAIATTCSSEKKSVTPETQTQRTGRANSSTDPIYLDADANLSANGTSIVFTSGRDSGTSRIYKTTFSSDAWSTPEKLSTSSGMTTENIAKISPDGTYVLVQGATKSGQSLSLCVFATGVCTAVTTTPWGFGKFEFNSSSSMFYYFTGTKATGGSLTIADVNSGTPQSTQIGTVNATLDAFWSTSSSLIATSRSTVSGTKILTTRSFASGTAAASATATDFSSTISDRAILDDDSASTTLFTMAAPLKASATKVFTEFGSIDTASKKSIPILNELHTWTIAGVDQGASSASTGFETVSAWITSDDATLFSLNRIATRCTGDADSTWGYSLALTTLATNAVTWRHLKKPTDLSQPPTITSDPCDRTVGGVATTLDFGPSELHVNSSATAASHTLVWTSDMTGDPEIFAMTTLNGTTTVYNISRNRKI